MTASYLPIRYDSLCDTNNFTSKRFVGTLVGALEVGDSVGVFEGFCVLPQEQGNKTAL